MTRRRMKMIKVGQIYMDNEGYMLFVITKEYINPQGGKKTYDWIYQTGMTADYISEKKLLSGATLIAEYPTWQEAINSKEFKGGSNEN